MKRNSIILCTLISLAVLLSAYTYMMPSVTESRGPNPVSYQTTPLPTALPVDVTPAATIVVVPVTGGGADTTTVLFYGILVLAGVAFLIMLFALFQRPSDRS